MEQFAFALDAPAIACKLAVGGDHAMAGYGNRQRIGCTRTGDRTDRGWTAKFGCNIPV